MKASPFVIAAVLLAGCSSPASEPASQPPATKSTTITVTSKSPEAIAHFKKGESCSTTSASTEAAEEFNQALKLDPDFVLAHAYHGLATPGPDGLKEIESAAAAAGSLPEAEARPDRGHRRGPARRASPRPARRSSALAELAPGDWRGALLARPAAAERPEIPGGGDGA